jgi:hypothetical protein
VPRVGPDLTCGLGRGQFDFDQSGFWNFRIVHKGLNFRIPSLDSRAAFLFIFKAIVDTGHARKCACDVVEKFLDDMRRHAEFRQAGGERSAQVVQDPISYAA